VTVKSNRLRRALALVSCLSCFTAAFSANPLDDATWKLLDSAKEEFARKEFGSALTLCEKSRQSHLDYVGKCVSALEGSLSSREVKKAGDAIADVRRTLVSRNETSSVDILDSILENHPSSSFGESMSRLMDWLRGKTAYPEADVLSGMIYEAEGERQIAVTCYECAWTHREYLDVPSEKYEIAYRLADISKYGGRPGDQEKYLLLVLTDEPLFGVPGAESPTLKAMIRSLDTEDTTEKFFRLYRYGNSFSLKACADLAALYRSMNRTDREFPPAVLSAVLSVTMLSSAVSARDFEYTYTSLGDLMERAGKNREIVAFAADNGLWNSFESLALALRGRGCVRQAASLLTEIASSCPDPETAQRSRDLMVSGF
jgi:hypothetical protein